jgi:hypothetical protein
MRQGTKSHRCALFPQVLQCRLARHQRYVTHGVEYCSEPPYSLTDPRYKGCNDKSIGERVCLLWSLACSSALMCWRRAVLSTISAVHPLHAASKGQKKLRWQVTTEQRGWASTLAAGLEEFTYGVRLRTAVLASFFIRVSLSSFSSYLRG